MGNSPKDTSKGDSKSPVQPKAEPPVSIDAIKDAKQDDAALKTDIVANAEPLAPPPRPVPAANTPDYFSANHGSHLAYETNPFENSFAGGGVNGGGQQTPGGSIKLPSVNALTSPAGLLGTATPGFWGSLRSGPLSPAMLSGPQKDDYFGDQHHLRGGFPTPNESGLRSGLTPGGGGSMFPEPSPNSQALFQQLASGGATPTTLDFHRTAMSAAAVQKREPTQTQQQQPNITSQPQDLNGMDVKPPPSGQFDANDAANGLFLLANARNGSQQGYAMANQMPVHAHPQSMPMQSQSTETSPQMANRNVNGSIDSGRGVSEASGGFSDESEQRSRPNTRGKGKRGSTSQTNGRRKAEETPSKPATKKSKGNNGNANSMSMAMEPEPPSEEEPDMNKDEYNANGKKMTDEEKRKNFLERNRVAALKCRQRKKQWLQNLQAKVEMFSAENDSLSAQISQLREEVVNLKTLLLAHKDCPVSQQQGIGGMVMQHAMDGYGNQMQQNPYGMAAPPMNHQQQIMAGQDPRRYS